MPDRLTVRVRPSVRLALVIGAAHLMGASGFWLAPVPWPLAAGATAVVAASLVMALRRHALRLSEDALIDLELREDGSAAACSRAGRWAEYRIDGSSLVSSALTIVNLRAEGGGRLRSILLTNDSVDAEAFRRLRVWLGWRRRADDDLRAGDQA